MLRSRPRTVCIASLALVCSLLPTLFDSASWAQSVEPVCDAAQPQPVPASFEGCADLEAEVEAIGSFHTLDGFRLGEYERLLARFLSRYCHRNPQTGWVPDKRVRDTGPYVAILEGGAFTAPSDFGTHLPVVIWYNAKMLRWLEKNRPEGGLPAGTEPEGIPDGAIMIKEMYPPPAARCARIAPERLKPPSSTGVALMIRDNQAAEDGWFWGAWWEGFVPDWPAQAGNGLPAMGFGAYCMNCHASAKDHLTFADLKNIRGEHGTPNVYLSQNFLFETEVAAPSTSRHRSAVDTSDDPVFAQAPLEEYNRAFLLRFPSSDPPAEEDIEKMPSQTYDNVWMPGGGPSVASEFITSDQCVGCHDAGSTGLQFDMTAQAPAVGKLINLSPYGTWRTSPMGLGGRDPIFFAQLASEIGTFHPSRSDLIQDVCLGCHGIQGQRQLAVDVLERTGECGRMRRDQLNAIPYPSDPQRNPQLASAPFGALGRDGIACAACHHMALTEAQVERAQDTPENRCVEERQNLLNPQNKGFARTFTGSFFVGPPDELYGPFDEPKTKPMEHALGIRPVHDTATRSSELCGTCHTVHLPIYGEKGKALGFTYEQTTYPEWAFSDFRTGWTPDGKLHLGPGPRAQSCQGCHMRSSSPETGRFRSKIASIQELSNFPAADNTLPGEEIDLAVRDGFARHTLVGLNVFFIEMAQQFPQILGIRTQDPMMVGRGLDPLLLTEQSMVQQASLETASLEITRLATYGETLSAEVTVTSKVGHKFPSGVGFRRAFLELSVLDASGKVLWASGRTDGAGVIVDEQGRPVEGELWWDETCSQRVPGNPHQPHYQTITRQDQVQIYQELVTAPAPVAHPRCGHDPTPGGQLTTSFLSICGHVKDNRLLPRGFLSLPDRIRIAKDLGAGEDLARDTDPVAVGNDPDYQRGGGDSLRYEIDLKEVDGDPSYVQATLYYQATPPFFLQDRFCTSESPDTQRLYFLAGNLDLNQGRAEDWKLSVVTTGRIPVSW